MAALAPSRGGTITKSLADGKGGGKTSTPCRRFTPSLIFTLILNGVIIVCTVCCFVLTSVAVRRSFSAERFKFAVMFDAGSSHTQMLIFKWAADKSDGKGGTSLVDQIASMDVKPGISSLVNATNLRKSVNVYFRGMLHEAGQVLKENKVDTTKTKIMLGATAGMRLLRLKNVIAADKIMREIIHCFREHHYHPRPWHVRIISGEEEAMSAWISVNVMSSRIHPQARKLLPFGALDLGGASTQIAFVPGGRDNVKAYNTTEMHLFGTKFHTYVRTFLCMGKEESRRLYLNNLLNKKNTSIVHSTVSDPCSMKGHMYPVNMHSLTSSPCYLGGNYANWDKATISRPALHRIEGTGNPKECRKLLQRMLRRDGCTETHCKLNNVYIPKVPPETKFVALSAFYYVWNLLGRPGNSMQYVRALVLKCLTPYDVALRNVTEMNMRNYVTTLCYDGWYTFTLLGSYGLDKNIRDSQLMVVKKIKGRDVGWAFGYVINQTNMIPKEYPFYDYYHFLTDYISLALLTTILLLSVALLILLCCRIRSCTTTSNASSCPQSNSFI